MSIYNETCLNGFKNNRPIGPKTVNFQSQISGRFYRPSQYKYASIPYSPFYCRIKATENLAALLSLVPIDQ